MAGPMFSGTLVDDGAGPTFGGAPATAAPTGKPMFSGTPVDDNGNPIDAGADVKAQMGKDYQYAANTATQGLSGINTGLADTLGAPVDLVSWIMDQGAKGINALDGGATNLRMPEHPVGGHDSIEAIMRGTDMIAPESSDPAQQILRKVGESVGGAIIPGFGLEAKAGGTVAHALTDLVPAATSGLAGGVSDQVAPGNQGAELASELIGGVVPSSLLATGRLFKGGPKLMDNRAGTAPPPTDPEQGPSLDELQAAKNAAYDRANALGVVYTPQGYQDLLGKIHSDATTDGLHPALHQDATAVIDRMTNAPVGYAPTLQELDQYRQLARRDAVTSSDARNAHFGNQIVDNIDDFMDNASGHQLAVGADPRSNPNWGQPLDFSQPVSPSVPSAQDGIAALRDARVANGVYKKTETIDDLVTAAQRASQNGPSGSLDMALRQRVKTILDNPKRSRGFTPDELAAMEDIVRPSGLEKAGRVVAGLAPSGNGIKSGMSVAGAMINAPVAAAAMIAGSVAKALVNGSTARKVAQLRALIAQGGMRQPATPFFNPQQVNGLTAMGVSAGANAESGPRTQAPPPEDDPLMQAILR